MIKSKMKMKTQEDVTKRLDKLYGRYLQKYVAASQIRKQCNCIWRVEADSLNRNTSDIPPMEYHPIPCRSQIHIVIEKDAITGVCTFGSEIQSKWNGDLCNTDKDVEGCKNFTPMLSVDEAVEEFNNLMTNDEYVIDNYKDIAVLQWILCTRVKTRKLRFFERLNLFLSWLVGVRIGTVKRLPPIKESLW